MSTLLSKPAEHCPRCGSSLRDGRILRECPKGCELDLAVDDTAICEPCMDGACDDCKGSAWCEAISFPCSCDCAESGHQLQRDIAEDQAADRALTAHYEERA